MKKMDFNDVIQLAAMVGIIASLIFVGLQMRQSQRIALAAQAQQRAAMLMDRSNAWLESGLDFQSIHFEQNYDAVISESMTAMRTSAHQSWFLYENDYEQLLPTNEEEKHKLFNAIGRDTSRMTLC